MTGAQVMSARSSQPPDTALIGAQPRPNTDCDPSRPRKKHSVTTSLLTFSALIRSQVLTQSAKCCVTQLSAPLLSQVSHFS